jgi:hypothetical protein
MKSQVSLEFLTGVILLLLIYLIVVPTFSKYLQSNVVESESGKEVCYTMATGIDSAVIGGNNFTINITLPSSIDGKNYTLTTKEGTSYLTVDWNDGLFSCTTTTQNVTTTTINYTNVEIKNVNGKIIINEVVS